MHKNLFQDMVKTKNENRKLDPLKKNKIKEDNSGILIKKIDKKINQEKVVKSSLETPFQKSKDNFEEYNYTIEDFNRDKKNKNKSSAGLWFFVFLSLFFLFFTVSSYLTKANVEVNPKVTQISLDDSFKANKDLPISDENLSYQLMIIEDSISREIASSGEIESEEKATGKIIIYNAFSTSPQSLNQDTRLEATGGKIFKTKEKVVIPGMSADGIPGSIEVEVIANEAGDSYNIPLSDFEIVGFRGTSKHKKIYARSLGEMTGGFKGKKSVIDEELKTNTEKDLKLELENILLKKALEQIPSGYVLFKNATLFEFNSDLKILENQTEKATLEINAKLNAFLFEEKNLVANILKNKLPKENPEKVYILNLRDLKFELANNSSNFAQLSEINFKLIGNSFVVSFVEEKELLDKLTGQPKKNFNNILFQFDSINNANLVIKPFWQNKIPEDQNKIKLKINYP